jgi:hypothetical protein
MAMPLRKVERVQTGLRIEKSMLKVMKGLAEFLEIPLGELVEGIVLHAFDGKSAFAGKPGIEQAIGRLKELYGMDYGSEAAHRMVEALEDSAGRR